MRWFWWKKRSSWAAISRTSISCLPFVPRTLNSRIRTSMPSPPKSPGIPPSGSTPAPGWHPLPGRPACSTSRFAKTEARPWNVWEPLCLRRVLSPTARRSSIPSASANIPTWSRLPRSRSCSNPERSKDRPTGSRWAVWPFALCGLQGRPASALLFFGLLRGIAQTGHVLQI